MKSAAEGGAAAYPLSKQHRLRFRIVLWLFVVAMVRIAMRLVSLHGGSEYDFSAEDIYHIGKVTIQASRGEIYDRNGRLLATDREVFSLSANPSRVALRVKDPRALSARLHLQLGLDETDVYERLTRQGQGGAPVRFVWVKRWLSPDELALLGDPARLEAEGLYLEKEPVRFYPEGQLAAHVLGFVNRDRVGGEGVEALYDSYLRGTQGTRVAWKDARRNLLFSQTLDYEPARRGDDIRLTIDANLQNSLENELDRVIERCNAERATGIFMDPNTGAILALANRPAYDPNEYWAWPDESRVNRAVVDVFEPGSAFKIVVAAAALEEGLVTPDELIDCEGGAYRFYGRRRISDVHRMGVVPFSECFAHSSNIAIIKVAGMVGDAGLEEWVRRFGFGEPTGCGLRPESGGIFRSRSQWSKLSMISLPMGQELAVTIVQLARAYCAIANGGFLVQPHIVEHIVDAEGRIVHEPDPAPPRRILHEDTAHVLRELCHGVVTRGTGVYANIPEYRVGGKTGTAQIAKPDGSGFYEDRYTTIFAGFAPLSEPRLCGVIVVHSPMIRLHFGGYVCGPVFQKVVREALIRMNCPADPVQVPVKRPAAHVEDADTLAVRFPMAPIELSVDDEDEGDDFFPMQLVHASQDVSHDGPRLPNLLGMTKRQVKESVANLGVHWVARGSGWVVHQDPPPGTPLYQVSVCRLFFSSSRIGTDYETERVDGSIGTRAAAGP